MKNPWLNCALPLHRFRQLFSVPVFDGIDEQALSSPQLRRFCACLFPTRQPLPDPGSDWIGFVRSLFALMQIEKMHFNPITGVVGPWIDLKRLHLVYGRNMRLPPDIPIQASPSSPTFQQQQQQQQKPPFQQPYSAGSFHQQQQQQPSWQQQNSTGDFQQPGQPTPQQAHPPHQQPSSPRAPAPPPAPETGLSASKYEQQQASGDEAMIQIKRGVITWATAPPIYQHLRSIEQLLGSMPQTLPPAYGLPDHDDFQKWKPFATDALSGKEEAVLKRGVYIRTMIEQARHESLADCLRFTLLESNAKNKILFASRQAPQGFD